MASVYLPEDVVTVLPWTKRVKIASFEAEAPDMIRVLSGLQGVKVIISLGMDGKEQLWPGVDVAYLHCVSGYPTPNDQINLSRIRSWPRTGLSDHTKHPITGALAVAAGAGIIEFHMRLWETFPGNADFLVSRNPEEAREYVELIRLAETMLWGKQGVQPVEEEMLRYRVKG
jgi:N-acetylneuraminate synthase